MEDRTFWRLAKREFQRNILNVLALVTVLALVLIGILAPQLAPYEPNAANFQRILEPPSSDHWMGTDEVGRDVFSRILYGTRLSFTIGVLAVALGALVGVSIGLLSGYYGGTLDAVTMRIIDVLMSFPGILLAMLIATALGAGIVPVILAVAIYSVPTFARLARSSALSVKEREFVEAALAAGAGDTRIILKHVFVNSFGPIVVYATLLLGGAILTAAALSFLGVGVPPPTAEWGAMISTGRSHMRFAPHVVLFPGLAIFITVLAFNVLGDTLRDMLDSKV